MRSLSRIMTRSFSAKATAVKQVTGNKGGNTPGVDGIVWNSPTKKAAGIGELVQRGYKAKPLRRVYIEKSNGKKRPLGTCGTADELIRNGQQNQKKSMVLLCFKLYFTFKMRLRKGGNSFSEKYTKNRIYFCTSILVCD